MATIEDQATMIGRILLELEKTGIEKRQLSVVDLGFGDEKVGLFIQAVQWLEVEKMISFERQTQQRFRQAALQSRGFAALGKTFSFEGENMTVREIAGQDFSTSGWQKAGAFLGSFTGSAMQTLPG